MATTTNADRQARIAEIDRLLARGVKSASHGDVRTDRDLEALAAERARLVRRINAGTSSAFRRVVFKSA